MGLLVDGAWKEDVPRARDGHFVRPATAFHNYITPDGSPGPTGKGGFPAEAGRYHLYVSLACPWASRALILRKLKKLEDVISVSVTKKHLGKAGWEFGIEPGATPDSVNGKSTLAEIYLLADPHYSGRVSVPVLWDKKRHTIVNNESAEIIRMLNSAFEAFTDVHTDYYPAPLRAEIDGINATVYANVNNGFIAPASPARRPPTKKPRAPSLPRSMSSKRGSRASAISSGGKLRKPTGGCSPRWCVSTRSTTATSSATCGASSIIPISGITCAISTRSPASRRP